MILKGASWACLAVLLLAARGACAEDARLPYKELCAMQKVQISLSRAHPNLALALQMRSTRPDVKPGAIAAFIDAKSGPISIPIGPDGAFKVPVRDDLLAEAPWVEVNQPKGTMQLNWHAGLSPSVAQSMTNAVRYGALMKIVRECDDVQEAMRQFFPAAPRLTAVGLRLTFRSSAIAPMAIIHARGGARRLPADTLGELIIPLDGDLIEENPLMTLTDTNVSVEIVTRKEDASP